MSLKTIGLVSVITVPLIASIAAASPAHAAEKQPKLSPVYDRCMDKAGGTTYGMLDCIGAEFTRQDARLNATYKTVMSRLTPAQQVELRIAERGWIASTKHKCDHAGDDNEGGSLQGVEINDCNLTETAKRADFLTAYRP